MSFVWFTFGFAFASAAFMLVPTLHQWWMR